MALPFTPEEAKQQLLNESAASQAITPEKQAKIDAAKAQRSTSINQTSSTPTVGDIYGGTTTPSAYDKATADYQSILQADMAPVDQAEIQRKTMEQFQGEIDALNNLYATKKAEERIAGEGRLGSSAAIQGRRGLLGSDFGAAQTDTTSAYNTRVQDALDAEKAQKISAIMSKARDTASKEYAAKTAARKSSAADYIAFLAGADTRKKANTVSLVADMIDSGIEQPEDFDALADQLGVTAQAVKAEYNRQKAAKEAAALAAKPKDAPPINVDGVLYEKQADGSYKAVTPVKEDKNAVSEFQYIPATKYQSAGYFDKSTGTFKSVDGKTSTGSVSDSNEFIPGPPVSTVPQAPKKTFEQFLAEEEAKVGQSFAPAKREQLRKQFEESQIEIVPEAANQDLSNYSYEVRQVILGKEPADSILSGGSAAERNRFRKELDDAEKKGLIKGTTSTYQREQITKLNDSVSKNASYARTVSMQQNINNVQSALSLGTGVGDLAAINQFQKVIDEGAVTRDQDVKLIQQSQSLLNTLKTKVKKLEKGEQLSPELRTQMDQAVESLYKAQVKALEKDPFIKAKQKEIKDFGVDASQTILGDIISTNTGTSGENADLRSKYGY